MVVDLSEAYHQCVLWISLSSLPNTVNKVFRVAISHIEADVPEIRHG